MFTEPRIPRIYPWGVSIDLLMKVADTLNVNEQNISNKIKSLMSKLMSKIRPHF